MIKETFKQAVQNVLSNKVRTFLTMLGIIIGVGVGNHDAGDRTGIRNGAFRPRSAKWDRT